MARNDGPVAAGAVVLRRHAGASQVLVVQRPAYDDWTLPKGKQEPDEDLPVVAVREVAEETGLTIRLGRPLGHHRYPVHDSKGHPRTKTVHWWLGHALGGDLLTSGTKPNKKGHQEVSQACWKDVDQARAILTYADEVELLDQALAIDEGHVVILVRHGKAMLRKNWSGKDWKRPLSSRGRRQAKRLVDLFEAYGITRLISSASTRCLQTLEPYAKATGHKLWEIEDLSEESFKDDPAGSARTMRRLLARAVEDPDEPMVICGHRPVLPMMRHELGLEPAPMLVAEVAVVHHHADGTVASVERIKSAY